MILRGNTRMAGIAGSTGNAEAGVTAATFPTAPLSETTTMEQQVPLAVPAIWDVEHLLFGSEQAADAATSQQQTGCTTAPAMLHA